MEDSIYELEMLFNLPDVAEITQSFELTTTKHDYQLAVQNFRVEDAINALTKLAELLFNEGLFKEALEVADKSLHLYTYHADYVGEIRSLLTKVRSLFALERLDEVLYPVTLAYNYSVGLEAPTKWRYILQTEIERLRYYEAVADKEKCVEIKSRLSILNEVLNPDRHKNYAP